MKIMLVAEHQSKICMKKWTEENAKEKGRERQEKASGHINQRKEEKLANLEEVEKVIDK
jgi:hypothetical protein